MTYPKTNYLMRKLYLIIAVLFSTFCLAQVSVKDEMVITGKDSVLTSKIRFGNDLVTVESTPEWKFTIVSGAAVAERKGITLKISAAKDEIDYSDATLEYYVNNECQPSIDKCFYQKIDNRTVLFQRRFSVDDPRYYYRMTNIFFKRAVLLEWYADIPVDGNEDELKKQLDEFAEYMGMHKFKISGNFFSKPTVGKTVKK